MKITLLSNQLIDNGVVVYSLSTIEDYTTLKLIAARLTSSRSLSTIEDYTTLKRNVGVNLILICLSTIEDYTTLKQRIE